MKHIDFLYNDEPFEQHTCSTCGKPSGYVMKCNECGKVFCFNCRPEWFESDEDWTDVTCECGSTTLFIWGD